MPIVLKSGNLNLLEPSGPVQACNGSALLGMWWGGWLRHCATNRKVAGSIPYRVIAFFIVCIIPATWSRWVTGISPGGRSKGGRCVWLTTSLPSCADCLNSSDLQRPGAPGPVQACNGKPLPLASFVLAHLLQVAVPLGHLQGETISEH